MKIYHTPLLKEVAVRGFTLIELMISVAIVGILAAVGFSLYETYTIRGQVSEGFVLVEGLKTAVVENYQNTGIFPANNASIGIGTIQGKYIGSIVSSGNTTQDVLTVNYSSHAPQSSNISIDGGTVTFTATPSSDGSIQWVCTPDGTIILQKYVPSNCTGP